MILQSLKAYYDRKASDPKSGIAPFGFEWKEIPFIVVLDEHGKPINIEDTREGEGKKKRTKRFLVPQSIKKTSGIASNLLWENPEYALGIVFKGKPERVKEQHDAFKNRIEALDLSTDKGIHALQKFLQIEDKKVILEEFATWEELLKTVGNISFKLVGDTALISEREAVLKVLQAGSSEESKKRGICLISGEEDSIEELHPFIKGVWGAQSSGANIVSFNLDAFRSHEKKQGENAPVGTRAAFAYTTALNQLLGKDSHQRIQSGDVSVVFWSEKSTDIEAQIPDIFGEPPKDDPDRNTKAIASLYKSVDTGAVSKDDDKTRFFVLGLSPNASRISIRFWIIATVPEIAKRILQHFEDIKIVHNPYERDEISLFRLLISTATENKAENIIPNIAGETMRAVLEGLPYPETLLQASIRRIRATHEVTHPRAALLKAYINRKARFQQQSTTEEIQVSLDINNPNIGYRLGRLFSALEKIQQESHPGINATIRDRFYGAASSTPVTVFSSLIKLSKNHLSKLEHPGRVVFFEKLIGEIMSGITDLPSHLTIHDQGRFAIGYYHQMNQFYTKKETEPSNE